MDERAFPNKEDLPVDVSELGEVQSVEQECPGVYYLAMKAEDSLGLLPREYYLVMENAPISKALEAYQGSRFHPAGRIPPWYAYH